MKRYTYIVLLLGLVFGAACGRSEAPNSGESSTSPSAKAIGQELYAGRCAICHGERGKGDGPAAKAGLPQKPADLTSPEIQKRENSELFRVIADGKPPFMPSWKEQLSKKEMEDIVQYIRHLGGKK